MLLDTNVKAARMVDAFKTLRSPQNSHGFSRINHSFRVRLCGLVLKTNSRAGVPQTTGPLSGPYMLQGSPSSVEI